MRAAMNIHSSNNSDTVQATRYDSIVIGLGLTGLACARYLASRGERIAVADTRPNPPQLDALRRELPQVPLFLGDLAAAPLMKAARLIVSPGLSLHEPALQAVNVPVLGDIELFAQSVTAPIAAITGANGKSTVTTLLQQMAIQAGLRAAAGGNLAPPALELLTSPEPDLFVLELSSFQLETTHSLNATAAVVLNITADHMDRYADMAAYQAAKARIYQGNGVMVINLDDPLVRELQQPDRQTLAFTLQDPGVDAHVFGMRDGWLVRGDEPLIAAADIRLQGLHNQANALAALALGTALDLPVAAMCQTLREFSGLPHRCQWVARKSGADWYNDSKGTNVGASIAAITGLAGVDDVILIAGGDGKGADFNELVAAMRGRVRLAILLGRDADRIATAIAAQVPVKTVADMPAAVDAAAAAARPGDKVLLSPACASLDMFRDYKHRGDVFTRAVQELP